MTVRLRSLLLVQHTGEVTRYDFDRHVTEIVGPKNSGKSTILRIIDWCLGDPDASTTLGPIVERYSAFELGLQLNAGIHSVGRRLAERGTVGSVLFDGEAIPASRFSSVLLDELGWPDLEIPLGRDPSRATALTRLSFRGLLRHIYRREDSWSEFASREQEFLRRAVVRYFLGILDSEHDLGVFNLSALDKGVERLEGALEEATSAADETLAAIGTSLDLGLVTSHHLDAVQADLVARIEAATAERERLDGAVRDSVGYAPEIGARYSATASLVANFRTQHAELATARAEYAESKRNVQAQIERLDRADASLAQFESVPIRSCPACGNSVSRKSARHEDLTTCFLCEQAVVADARSRRIELERRALADEATDLDEVIGVADSELESIAQTIAQAEKRHAAAVAELNSKRAAALSPYAAALEAISASIASLIEKQNALTGARVVVDRRDRVRQELDAAYVRRDAMSAAITASEARRQTARERCTVFADRMNEFLTSLQRDRWEFGRVVLYEDDMEFRVGGRPWNHVLGGEARVPFFLAYHYALLHLGQDFPGESRPPGLAILDNPIQQGLRDDDVADALRTLYAAANKTDTMVVTTLSRRLAHGADRTLIRLTERFGEEDAEAEEENPSSPD